MKNVSATRRCNGREATARLSNNTPAARAPELLLRRGRRDEFLEARIVPQRIEHWIEPEQRGSERRARHCATVRDRE